MMQALVHSPALALRRPRIAREARPATLTDLGDGLARLGLTPLSAGYDAQTGRVRIELLESDVHPGALDAAREVVVQWQGARDRRGDVVIALVPDAAAYV